MFRYKDYVYAVFEEGGFSKAAFKCNISQPALSATVKKAEERFGHPIFNRGALPITLTEYGVHYINAVIQINNVEEDLMNNIDAIETLRAGEITIGTNHVYASLIFPQLIGRFNRQYPKVQIRLLEGAASSNEARLSHGDVDLILDCSENLSNSGDFERVALGTETLLLAARTEVMQRYLPSRSMLRYEDVCEGKSGNGACPDVSLLPFADAQFVLLTEGNDTRYRADQMFLAAGIAPAAIIEVEQMATAYRILEKNDLVSLISDTLIKRSEPKRDVSFCRVHSPHASREMYFTYAKKQYVRRVITEFVRFAGSDTSWLTV